VACCVLNKPATYVVSNNAAKTFTESQTLTQNKTQ